MCRISWQFTKKILKNLRKKGFSKNYWRNFLINIQRNSTHKENFRIADFIAVDFLHRVGAGVPRFHPKFSLGVSFGTPPRICIGNSSEIRGVTPPENVAAIQEFFRIFLHEIFRRYPESIQIILLNLFSNEIFLGILLGSPADIHLEIIASILVGLFPRISTIIPQELFPEINVGLFSLFTPWIHPEIYLRIFFGEFLSGFFQEFLLGFLENLPEIFTDISMSFLLVRGCP